MRALLLGSRVVKFLHDHGIGVVPCRIVAFINDEEIEATHLEYICVVHEQVMDLWKRERELYKYKYELRMSLGPYTHTHTHTNPIITYGSMSGDNHIRLAQSSA